jgi:glycosyltransferase involved in cell wall biosynthesis
MFGALREAKGVRNVINAFGQLDAETAARARLCLLGEVQPDLKGVFPELISSLRHVQSRLDLQVEDRFLPDEELEAALQAADVVLAPYLRTEGSSGVVGLSARYRSPVIGPDSGLVGSLIEQYDLGLTVNASDPTAIATAIRRYIRQRPDGKATEGMQSYVHERTPERFAETIFSAVLNGKY